MSMREPGNFRAKHITEYVKTISRVERVGTSKNGNPTYEIVFTDGTTARTQTDAGVVYGLPNPGNIGVPVTVKATPAGRVWSVEPVTPETHEQTWERVKRGRKIRSTLQKIEDALESDQPEQARQILEDHLTTTTDKIVKYYQGR